jgi:hypothetical protein
VTASPALAGSGVTGASSSRPGPAPRPESAVPLTDELPSVRCRTVCRNRPPGGTCGGFSKGEESMKRQVMSALRRPVLAVATMRRTFSMAAALAAALTAGLAAVAALSGPAARADQVYHSQHIALQPVGGTEPLRSGFVENIHTNGPTIYAHEIYVLNGAAPATTYQVTLNIFVGDPACAGSAGVVIPTAPITTNAAGNGRADAAFTPSDADGLRHATHGVIWTVSDSSGVRYTTGCQAITLD